MNFSRRRFLSILLLASCLLFAEVKNGSKTITTAGAAEAIGPNELCSWVTVQADPANTTVAYLGDSTVSSSLGIELDPGESHHFPEDVRGLSYNLAEIFADVATSGEGFLYVYRTP